MEDGEGGENNDKTGNVDYSNKRRRMKDCRRDPITMMMMRMLIDHNINHYESELN